MKKVLLVAVLTISLGIIVGGMLATQASAFGFGARGHSVVYWGGWGGCWYGAVPYAWGWYGCGPAWCAPCAVKAKGAPKAKPAEKKAAPAPKPK